MKKDFSKIIIVDSALGDERDLVFVAKKTWLATYPNKEYGISRKDILLKDFDSKEKIDSWGKIIKNSGKKSKYICVAKHNGKVIGFCFVSKKNNFNELNALYILPEYQKMGIGRKLVNKSVDWLGRGKNITVKAASYNKNAIDFYERYGFIKTGAMSKNRLVNKKIIPEIQLIISFTESKPSHQEMPHRCC